MTSSIEIRDTRSLTARLIPSTVGLRGKEYVCLTFDDGYMLPEPTAEWAAR